MLKNAGVDLMPLGSMPEIETLFLCIRLCQEDWKKYAKYIGYTNLEAHIQEYRDANYPYDIQRLVLAHCQRASVPVSQVIGAFYSFGNTLPFLEVAPEYLIERIKARKVGANDITQALLNNLLKETYEAIAAAKKFFQAELKNQAELKKIDKAITAAKELFSQAELKETDEAIETDEDIVETDEDIAVAKEFSQAETTPKMKP